MPPQILVGVELEDDEVSPDIPIDLTNGSFMGRRYFKCPQGKGLFIDPKFCSVDRRFDNDLPSIVGASSNIYAHNSSATNKTNSSNGKQLFGQIDCPIIPGRVAPLSNL